MSMIASSTTTPTATANPARIIVLMVAPVASNTIAAAASDIDASNKRTDEVMTDRREALDSVVNQIDSKVGDLDHRLKRFSALMAETFEAAEGRARDIARVLAESSTEGTKAIANQYELVRATSDEERRRTSEA